MQCAHNDKIAYYLFSRATLCPQFSGKILIEKFSAEMKMIHINGYLVLERVEGAQNEVHRVAVPGA
jgi:hypothetical protein